MVNLTFYGTRGSFPLAGERYMEYGGATTCVLLRFNKTTIMVDCGSGANIAVQDLKDVDELHLFISHFHSDHISGFVTLLPAFANKKLHIYYKSFNGTDAIESIERVMSEPLWPISIAQFENIKFHIIDENPILIDDVKVTNMDSNHPGGCSLYRFDDGETSVVTAFDFNHFDGFKEKLLEFAKGTKILIYDGNMNQAELEKNPTWGHSTPEMGAEIASELKVEKLYITHHGYRTDDELSTWEKELHEKYSFLQFAKSGMRKNDLLKMIDIGKMLSSQLDNDELLCQIVETAMDITGADGGSLYLLNDNQLDFKVLITKSKNRKEIKKGEFSLPSVSINGNNVCAVAAREKKSISVADVYGENDYDFSDTKKFDDIDDYKSKSMLVVPMNDDNGELIGVVQVINAINENGEIIPFKKQDESLLVAIANQAAMSIENVSYSNKISDLLYGFVKVMSIGVDERSPYNAFHTKNMVAFAENFLEYENANNGPYSVDYAEQHEILMSIWLHDVGKIFTPIEIMNKDSRLGTYFNNVYQRFERRDLLLRLALAKNRFGADKYKILQNERQEQFDLINKINRAPVMDDYLQDKLDKLSKEVYQELDGNVTPVITQAEYIQLSIQKGTLTKAERDIMENHVVLTQKLLDQLDFPKGYEHVKEYAGNHHEFLDGSGYPNHLTAKNLSWPCRLITILDIFEALTAKDRPYKKQIPLDESIKILHDMASQGKIDEDIVNEFEKSKAWII